MIFISLGNKPVSGKKINKGLETLLKGNPVGESALDGFTEITNSFEFVPRVSDWHYRDSHVFYFSKDGSEYLLQVIPVNPQLQYQEIGFIPYYTEGYNLKCAKQIIIPEDSHDLIKSISRLCDIIAFLLLRELKIIK